MKIERLKKILVYGIAFGFIHRKKWGKNKYWNKSPPLLITNYFLFYWSLEFCPFEAYLFNYVRFYDLLTIGTTFGRYDQLPEVGVLLINSARYTVNKLPKYISVDSEEVSVAIGVLSVELLQQFLILPIQYSLCQPRPHPDFPMPLLPTSSCASSTLFGLFKPHHSNDPVSLKL